MKNVLISGLLNIETTLRIKEFPIPYFPIDYPFFGINSSVSGVAVNIAKAESALGDEVSVLSMLGNDEEGNRIIEDLQREGIRTDYIKRELEKSPASIVLFDQEGKRQIYCDLKDVQDKSYRTKEAKEALERCDIAVICNTNFNRELLKEAKRMGKLIATDVHVLGDINDDYNRDFMEAADILFLSDENIKGSHQDFLKKLKDTYDVKIIVLGRGGKGSMIYIREEDTIYEMEAVTVRKVVNTVGAGDALFSAFIHYYIKGIHPIESLKRAQIFAAYKIGFNGAATGFLGEKELEEIFEITKFNIKK
jgi:ribokinase